MLCHNYSLWVPGFLFICFGGLSHCIWTSSTSRCMFLWVLLFLLGQHSAILEAQPKETKGIGQTCIVATPKRSCHFGTVRAIASSPTPSSSSFLTRLQPDFCSPVDCHNGDTESWKNTKDSLEMQLLLGPEQTGQPKMSALRGALDSGPRHDICLQATSTQRTTTDVRNRCLGLGTMAWGCPGLRSQPEEAFTVNIQKGQRSQEAGTGQGRAHGSVSTCTTTSIWWPTATCGVTICNFVRFAAFQASSYTTFAWNDQRAGFRTLSREPRDPQSIISRHHVSPTCNPKYDRESREGRSPKMEDCHEQRNRKRSTSTQGTSRHEGSKRATQSIMDCTSREQRKAVEIKDGVLRPTAEAFRYHDHRCQEGDSKVWQHCERAQPACRTGSSSCLVRSGIDTDSSTRQRQREDGDHLEEQCQDHFATMHRSDRGGRHRCRGRRFCPTQSQACKIRRTRWYGRLMMLGSMLLCPSSNTVCLPSHSIFKAVRFSADAYWKVEKDPLDRLPSAACRHCPSLAGRIFHSILLDDDCVYDFDAVGFALDLQAECIQDTAESQETLALQVLEQLAPSCVPQVDPNSVFDSGVPDGTNEAVNQSASFHLFVPPNGEEFEFQYEVPGDEAAGHIDHLPVTPLDQHAKWIQEMYQRWLNRIGEVGPDDELAVRTWYLHPVRYEATTVWRPAIFPPTYDGWWNTIRAVWHDLFEHDEPVEAFVVHPDPERPQADRYAFDLIICQELDKHPLVRPALVVAQFVGPFTRQHLTARLLPQQVSKWELIYINQNDRFCAGPGWDVNFYRLCEVRRDRQILNAVPENVWYGDCFCIDLYPPMQIFHEDDVNFLMGRNPVITRSNGDQDDAVDVPTEDSIESQSSRSGADSFSVIVFAKHTNGVIGRIAPRNQGEIYAQTAGLLEIPRNTLISLHELPSPPKDLNDAFDKVWIANRLNDIDPGSLGKLVLIDVTFCDNLPKLDVDVTRQVKILVSPMTRSFLLRLLGLEPYCDRWPCLVQSNNEFVPHVAPFSVRHGNYINVVVSPPEPHQCVTTRLAALAFHHALTEDAFPHIALQLPEGMDSEQIPNPDPDLTHLEFDDPARFELWQSQVRLQVPTSTFRLDESDEARQRISEVINERGMLHEEFEDFNIDDVAESLRGLVDPWNEVATSWHDQSRWAPVAVWFISHLRWRICTMPRFAWLSNNLAQWRTAILDTWIDQVDQTDAAELAFVRPEPYQREPNIAGHVIIIQHREGQEEHAALVSMQDSGHRNGEVVRQAMVLPVLVTHETLLVVSNRLQDCLARPTQLRCRTMSGTFELTHEAMIGWEGCSYTVLIERHAHWPSAAYAENIFPVPMEPNVPPIIRAIYANIVERRNQQPHEPINLRIMSWYLDHVRHRKCLYGRFVDLPPNPNQWLLAIIHQWPDLHDPRVPVEGFLVAPTPSTMLWQIDDMMHVILHQRPLQDHSSVLVTTFDQTQRAVNPPGIQRAVVVPSALTHEDILQSVDLDTWCRLDDHDCHVTYGPTPIMPSSHFQCSSGFSFKVFFFDAPPEPWPMFQNEPRIQLDHTDDADVTTLLQTKVTYAVQAVQPPDWSPVERLRDLLDTHYFLPRFDLPRPSAWHPACYEWLDLDWWDFTSVVYNIVVYYDGSFYKQEERRAGCAVAAFVQTEHGWLFAGALSSHLPEAQNSYQAELWAAIVATKFCYDLTKTALSVQGWVPTIHLCFDAQTIGMQADGSWDVKALPREGLRLRSLHQWIEATFHTKINSWHIPGHDGEPGNEIVDHLAKLAAEQQALHDLQDWLTGLFERGWDHCFPWLWVTPDRQGLITVNQELHYTHAESEVLDFPTQESVGTLKLRCGTCNVLTLKSQNDQLHEIGAETPSRLAMLLRQAKETRLAILALQEARTRRPVHCHTDDFFLFRASSSDRGHFGLLLAFTRTLPIGSVLHETGQQEVYFREEDFAIITSQPRILIVRVHNSLPRAIVVNAHAPHTGANSTDIEQYWQSVGQFIPAKYSHWDIILCTDANARVGSEPSEFIGPHLAENHDDKAESFCAFVHDNGLFLPSTFQAFHSGPGGTWKHPKGTWHRNDFIALPTKWNYEHCASWVEDCIDPSLLRDDHRAAAVELQCHLQPFGNKIRPKVAKLQPREVPIEVWQSLEATSAQLWTSNVSEHAQQLESALVQTLQDYHVPALRSRRKDSLSEPTWNLICEKRTMRKHLNEAQQAQDRTVLQMVFLQWNQRRHGDSDSVFTPQAQASLTKLLREQDCLVAKAWSIFRQLRRDVVRAVRADDVAFYASLTKEGSEHLGPSETRKFWKIVQRSLPKHRQRRMQPPPLQIESFEDKWTQHFEEIEAGSAATLASLQDQCNARHANNAVATAPVALHELPTLLQVENAIRATKNGRATGLDPFTSDFYHGHAGQIAKLYYPLLLKIFQLHMEPACWKGGVMAVLPKTGDPQKVSHFRGIMLLHTMAKCVHTLLRKQLVPILDHNKPPGQMGGFPHQEVMFSSQYIRMFGRVASSHGFSSGVLFLDLQQAFHRLVRESVPWKQRRCFQASTSLGWGWTPNSQGPSALAVAQCSWEVGSTRIPGAIAPRYPPRHMVHHWSLGSYQDPSRHPTWKSSCRHYFSRHYAWSGDWTAAMAG